MLKIKKINKKIKKLISLNRMRTICNFNNKISKLKQLNKLELVFQVQLIF